MRNILFTPSDLLDPSAISQDPHKTQSGFLQPACYPTSMAQCRPGRLLGGAGPAWAQPMDAICRSERWEENGSLSSTAQPQTRCLKPNNSAHTESGCVCFSSPLPSLGSRSHLHHLEGRHSPFVSNKSRLSPAASYSPQQQEQGREHQDSRCSWGNHQWRDVTLQLTPASMLELVRPPSCPQR